MKAITAYMAKTSNGMLESRYDRYRLVAAVLAAGSIAATSNLASAAEGDSSSGSSAAVEGGATVPSSVSESDDARASGAADGDGGRFAVPGLGFTPGFGTGCVNESPASASFGEPGVLQILDINEGPAKDSGRYAQLSVSGSEIFTDNINREPDSEAMNDFILSVAPQLDACSSTGRFRGSLSYQLQGLVYANNSQYNDVYNDVLAKTTLDLIPQRLFLDADTRYGQTVIDPSFSFGRSNAIRPNQNRTSSWVSNISPYLLQSLGPIGQASLRYRYGFSQYGDSDVADSTINAVYLDIVSPPTREPLGYRVKVASQSVERTGGNEARFFNDFNTDPDVVDPERRMSGRDRTTHFDTASLELDYQLTRSLTALAEGGAETQFNRDGSTDRYGSEFWNAGLRWSSIRNTLEARYGHRFYGSTYNVEASHRGDRFDASLSYEEEATSQALNALNGGSGFGSGMGLGTGGNFGGGTDVAGPTTSLFDRGVFVEKSLRADVGFDTALTRTDLNTYRQVREYRQSDVGDETFYGAVLTNRYDFTRRMTAVPRIGWENRDGRDIGGGYDRYDVGASVVRALSPDALGSVGYQHGWRDGDNEDTNYKENIVTVQFRKSF